MRCDNCKSKSDKARPGLCIAQTDTVRGVYLFCISGPTRSGPHAAQLEGTGSRSEVQLVVDIEA